MMTAKLFTNGRSQAVRLPKQFRFEGTEVLIHKEGERVILEAVPRREWPKGYWSSWKKVPEDFHAPPALPSAPPEADLELEG